MDIFFWVFSSRKKCSRIGLATAQLCHNTMEKCIVTQHLWTCSRLLGVSQKKKICYRDLAVVRLDGWETKSRYNSLYHDWGLAWLAGRVTIQSGVS